MGPLPRFSRSYRSNYVSNVDRPEVRALEDLEEVVGLIVEELSTFRRRAKQAEAAQAKVGTSDELSAARLRIEELEAENQDLRARVEAARSRVTDLLSRVQFLEEQVSAEPVSP
jgi:predicted  nucleic acid-binding Zn-ribbon protein